jgi:two-component system, OmpR family, phosphate regulon response regulator PhoB
MLTVHPEPRTILIVERDHTVRELQQYFLALEGFVVEFADDGESALALTVSMRPVLIITEILLPKLDGLTLCRRLRQDPVTRNIPVIVFSILAAGTRAAEAGASAFLRKPLVESIFVVTVLNAIAAQPTGIMEQQWVTS